MQYQTYMQPAATSMPMPFQTSLTSGTAQMPTYTSSNLGTYAQADGTQVTYTTSSNRTYAQAPQTYQTQTFAPAQFMNPPTMSAPLTPKVVIAPAADINGTISGTTAKVIASAMGTKEISIPSSTVTKKAISTREITLESQIRELEAIVASKDRIIQDLEVELASIKQSSPTNKSNSKSQSPGRKSGFRNVNESKPAIRYSPGDPDDNIDVRLAEYYNSTNSAIQFKRINRGFYRFGETIVELDIVNHKLMAKTEDGWNRGKLAPIEKFMMQYENIEREKIGILPEN